MKPRSDYFMAFCCVYEWKLHAAREIRWWWRVCVCVCSIENYMAYRDEQMRYGRYRWSYTPVFGNMNFTRFSGASFRHLRYSKVEPTIYSNKCMNLLAGTVVKEWRHVQVQFRVHYGRFGSGKFSKFPRKIRFEKRHFTARPLKPRPGI